MAHSQNGQVQTNRFWITGTDYGDGSSLQLARYSGDGLWGRSLISSPITYRDIGQSGIIVLTHTETWRTNGDVPVMGTGVLVNTLTCENRGFGELKIMGTVLNTK